MKLIVTLLVRDEEDIVALNVKHHLLAGADEVIVTDNASVDRTPGILRQLVAETGRVHVIHEPAENYSQSDWVTRMARLAAQRRADWIVHADADEFFFGLRLPLKDALAQLPTDVGWVAVPRLEFAPTRNEEGAFYQRLVARYVRPLNAIGRPLPHKIAHRASPDVHVGQGNHVVRSVPGAQSNVQPLVAFHYPMRTYAQFENKIRLGGAAYEMNQEQPKDVGATWRHLYQLHLKGELSRWYLERALSPEDIAAGIDGGKLVADRRMAQILGAIASGTIWPEQLPRRMWSIPAVRRRR